MIEKNKNVLDLKQRKKIFNIVSKHAGSHIRDLERKSGIAFSTLKYHLHYLVKKGLIYEKEIRGKTQYFPNTIDRKDSEILSLLRQKNIRRILTLLVTIDYVDYPVIENYTGLSKSTVSWYLNKLERRGLVIRTRSEGKVFLKLNLEKDRIIRLIISYRESFLDKLVDKTIEMWDM